MGRLIGLCGAMVVALGLPACSQRVSAATRAGPGAASAAGFSAYWNTGLGEISRFQLRQARYGEVHEGGEAVMVFVTEDFLPDKQVKSERVRPREAVVPVLKLNLLRRFPTGIYSYAMMSSVFVPASLAPSLPAIKVTTSSQEWCGHTWLQLNRRAAGGYDQRSFSYFEDEADEHTTLADATLEDELWVRIRLDPAKLSLGRVRLVPGTMSARLRHRRLAPEDAEVSLRTPPPQAGRPATRVLDVRYLAAPRTLSIEFREAFPHEIEGFSETYAEGGRTLGTEARRTHLLRDAYWSHNRRRDLPLREKLGIGPY